MRSKMKQQQHYHRLSGTSATTNMIIPPPPTYLKSNSYNDNSQPTAAHQMIRLGNYSSSHDHHQSHMNNSTALAIPGRAKGLGGISSLISSLLSVVAIPSFTIIPATCRWLTSSIISSASSALSTISGHPIRSSKVTTGTLFGHRKGHAFLAIQEHPRSEPILILDLPMSTSALVKEMSSGLVRIALECNRKDAAGKKRNNRELLLAELEWTMYCNSRKCGTARSTEGSRDFATFVLGTVGSISVGAGVIPVVSDGRTCESGELMYMRARFERAVGNCHSEAFYMLNPEGHAGGPELSIFLLRL